MAEHAPKFMKLVENAKTRIKELTIRDIKTKVDQDEEFFLVDVREQSEWAAGHLPHATHLGKGIIERDIEKAIPDPDAQIALYCGGGFRSALATDNLQNMGYRNVWSVDGGFRAWKEAGHPIES